MPNKTLRIEIPTNVEDALALGALIYEEHQRTGGNTPLSALQDYDINVYGPKIAPALVLHKEAEALVRQAEEKYRQRDEQMGDVFGFLKSSRDLLKGAYAKTPKRLGEFGFVVNDTPKAKAPKKDK